MFTGDDNQRMRNFCAEHGLAIKLCGKPAVTKNAEELPVLDKLISRTRSLCVEPHKITIAEAKDIDPRIHTQQYDLLSHLTASVDSREVMLAFIANSGLSGIYVINYPR